MARTRPKKISRSIGDIFRPCIKGQEAQPSGSGAKRTGTAVNADLHIQKRGDYEKCEAAESSAR